MRTPEYKALCHRIYSRFRKPLRLLYCDACELADLVAWNKLNEDQLFLALQAQASVEAGKSNAA